MAVLSPIRFSPLLENALELDVEIVAEPFGSIGETSISRPEGADTELAQAKKSGRNSQESNWKQRGYFR